MSKHFLVVGGTSRVARYFIKKALLSGYNVTTLCRASDDIAATIRMQEILTKTKLTPNNTTKLINSIRPGQLTALSHDVTKENTYIRLFSANPTINAIFSFIGPNKNTLFNFKIDLYTSTVSAIISGIKKSRSIEFYYHSSVGTEGIPGECKTKLPAHYSKFENFMFSKIYPVFKNVTESENILGKSKKDGIKFVVFRPDALTDSAAKRKFIFTFDNVKFNKPDFDLNKASKFISREDVAEEILRVVDLPLESRQKYFGHAVYLVDQV
jgi:nucleoside-diphosphate-sugar epimerase